MNYYSDFVVSFGLTLVLIGAAASWLFKLTGARLYLKLLLPTALIALACHTPLAVNGLLGLPVDATMGTLPVAAKLIAFQPIDNEKRVDLWMLSGGVPRAYQIPLDETMKRLLKEAQAGMRDGSPVYIKRKESKKKGKAKENGAVAEWNRDEKVEYELVPGAALLPPKE